MRLDPLAPQLTGWNNPRERLTAAFRNNEFLLFQQRIWPVSTDATGDRVFAEILVRLHEEEQNLTPPGTFIPVLEEAGLMPLLDRWVVERTLEWLWTTGRKRNFRFSLNVSIDTLAHPDFPKFLSERLERYRQRASCLVFEMQEFDVAANAERIGPAVKALQTLGCNIAVGSVGRQTATLKVFQSVRAHYVKIDGSLVREMQNDRTSSVKIQALSRICRGLGARTIAEFVEDSETLMLLKTAGVHYAQGFGLSRPAPIAELA